MINICIPAAGRGKRFSDAGYKDPKPLIKFNGDLMLNHILKNVTLWAGRFILIVNKQVESHPYFNNVNLIQTRDDKILVAKQITGGAAETVLLAKEFINNEEELLIVNSDQIVGDNKFLENGIDYFRKNKADGGIFCFWSDSPKWSYARIANNEIREVVEKSVISPHATVGIYYYRKGKDFVAAAEYMLQNNIKTNGETYVAPSFNQIIIEGKKVLPFFINSMHGLGTPEDLEKYINETR